MEGVDYTSRRHIGYHKNSKSQLLSQGRSSSCPRYTSPPAHSNRLQNKEKGKGDLICGINKGIEYFLQCDRPSAKNSSGGNERVQRLLNENTRVKADNARMSSLLAAFEEENGEKEANFGFDDSSYYKLEHTVYLPLLLENRKLKKELSKHKQHDMTNHLAFHNNTGLKRRIGALIAKLSNDIEAFSSIYTRTGINKESYDEQFEKRKASNFPKYSKLFNKDKDDNTLYFEENSNITNLTEEDTKNNIVIITEKSDDSYKHHKEKTSKLELPLEEFISDNARATPAKSITNNTNNSSAFINNMSKSNPKLKPKKASANPPKTSHQKRYINYP